MCRFQLFRRLLPALVLVVLGTSVFAAEPVNKPLVHPLFSDNIVLQRGVKDPIWGWTKPGAKVTVSIHHTSVETTANDQGRWMAKVGPLKAGGPYTLTVKGPRTVTLDNVLIGDVWLCSGQSNMEFGIGNANDAKREIAAADHPRIRLFAVAHATATTPQAVPAASDHPLHGSWQVCTPQTVAHDGVWGGFSAVAYFFGRDLHERVKVPIGLIHSSWGGTVAEAWTAADHLKTLTDFKGAVEQMKKSARAAHEAGGYEALRKRWYQKNDPGSAHDQAWAKPKFDASQWRQMKLPGYWQTAGLARFDGIVWYRRQIHLSDAQAGSQAIVHLGPIDDADTTWINGKRVGATDNYKKSRGYKIPADVLKAGVNVIATRVLDTGGKGGFWGKAGAMKLDFKSGPADSKGQPRSISLAGSWRYHKGPSLEKMTAPPTRINHNPNRVTVLYNAMIAPLTPYAIKGAIWYQGESNAARPDQYHRLLPVMIKSWRQHFDSGRFPFLIVQLANFMKPSDGTGSSKWAQLRDAQRFTAEHTPNAALASAIDLGSAETIHPKNKQDVGRRLMLDALALAYGQKIVHSGPTFAGMKTNDGKIRLRFDHAEGGLVVKGKKLKGFVVAGEDGKYHVADAQVDGDEVVVSAPSVEHPKRVRYDWANNPMGNLYNQARLPAVPFRSDSPWESDNGKASTAGTAEGGQ